MGRASCLYPLSPYGDTKELQSLGSFLFVTEVAWLLGIIASAVSVFLLSGHVSTFSLAYIAGLCTGCFLLIVLVTVKFGCCFAEDLGLKDYLGWKTPGWNWVEERYPFLWILVDILLWVLFGLLWGLGLTATFFEEKNNAMSIFLQVLFYISAFGFGRPDVAIIFHLFVALMLFSPLIMGVCFLVAAMETHLWPESGQIEGSDNSDEKECPICLEVFIEGVEVKKLQCGHIHHTQCVDKWLKRSATCPLCKMQVTLEGGQPLQRSHSV